MTLVHPGTLSQITEWIKKNSWNVTSTWKKDSQGNNYRWRKLSKNEVRTERKQVRKQESKKASKETKIHI